MSFRSLSGLVSLFFLVGMAGAARADGADGVLCREFIYSPGPYPSCHASTLVETRSGRLLAAWFGGSHEGASDVRVYVAAREAQTWSPGRPVADGLQPDGSHLPVWNPVFHQEKDGPLLLFYKVGRSPSEWWGEYKTSLDEGRSWGPAVRLPCGALGPAKNKPVCLPDGTLLCGSSQELPGAKGIRWRIRMELSRRPYEAWCFSEPAQQEGVEAIQPALLPHRDGRLEILCRSRQQGVVAAWSEDHGYTWSSLAPLGLPSANSGLDAVALKDGRFLLVYNDHSGRAASAGEGENDRCPLSVALSEDGVHWRGVLVLESTPLPSGYAYPSVIQTKDGRVHISYTWNRERIVHVLLDPARL